MFQQRNKKLKQKPSEIKKAKKNYEMKRRREKKTICKTP